MTGVKNILSGLSYLSLYLIILIIINIALLFFPLTRVFGYEFSAINSLFIVLFSGLYSISLLKLHSSSALNLKNFFRRLFLIFILFLTLPAAISIINSLLTVSCSVKDGIEFYIVLTIPAAVIGMSIATISFSITKRFARLIFILLFLSILLIPLLEFYFNPQVYFYNPIFGYYPGTIYDEGLSVTIKLLVYRILNSAFFGATGFFLMYSIIKNSRALKILFLICSLVTAALFYCVSPYFGYSTTFGFLEKKLGGKIITPHFVIYYPLEMGKNDAESMVLHHEYYYERLMNFFGYEFKGKIRSFVFKNDTQKKELFGTGNADVAKPWLGTTYIAEGDVNTTLRHEIAHCYSAAFGTGLLKVASGINPFLIEGIAVAAAPVYGENDIDYMAALAYNNGYRISIKNMLHGFGFYTSVSSVGYIYAGSFVKYLVGKFGMKKFKKFYAGGSFNKIYGLKLKDEEKEFYGYLSSYNGAHNKDKAYYYFGRGTLFSKVCPRFVYDRLQKAWKYYSEGNYISSEKIFMRILNKTDNYSALIGLAESNAKLDKIDTAVKIITDKIGKFKNTGYYYNLEFRLADLLVQSGNFAEADTIYSQIKKQKPSRTLYYLADLRLALSKDTSALKLYLKGSDYDKLKLLNKLNGKSYVYSSFPVIINLSGHFNENFKLFLKNFNKPLKAFNYISSYAVFKISEYMLSNLDFKGARKTAVLAMRHLETNNFMTILKGYYEKCDWIFKNHKKILDDSKFLTTN